MRRLGAVLSITLSGACAAHSAPPSTQTTTSEPQEAAPPAQVTTSAAEPPPGAEADDGMGAPQPKRAGPPQVDPVLQGALRFEVVHWGRERGLAQNGGLIAAYDPKSNKELWTLQVYTTQYDSALEEDVQDVFIETLAAGPGPQELTVVDERGRTYRVDTRGRNARLVESTR